jgi:hypothetical protein
VKRLGAVLLLCTVLRGESEKREVIYMSQECHSGDKWTIVAQDGVKLTLACRDEDPYDH